MSDRAPGQRLGSYELICLVTAGGMGEVWKARDTRLQRAVAVKFSQDRFSDRFEREAHAIAALALSAEAEREPLSVIVNWQAGLKR